MDDAIYRWFPDGVRSLNHWTTRKSYNDLLLEHFSTSAFSTLGEFTLHLNRLLSSYLKTNQSQTLEQKARNTHY